MEGFKMKIEILNGNFLNEKSAYAFGEMLAEELKEKDLEVKIIHHPFTTAAGNGVSFYGVDNEDDEDIILQAIEDTFSRSDMWEAGHP